jgi:N-methylhydantoinase B
VDQVTLTVIHNYLITTCREMGLAMMRTAYSPIFSESLDFSCVIFNRSGRLIGQAEFCPSQIGTIKGTVEILLEEMGLDAFKPGDVLLTNDPYRGCGHVPEFTVLKGVFDREERLQFYVANCAHMAEPGAKTPGGLAGDATEIYQEGLILPPVWLQRKGRDVQDIWEIIFANHRTPEVTNGDLHAMVGSLDIAERRLNELIERYGSVQVDKASDELLSISERRMRAEIQKIPDGVFSFEDVIEDDGIEERPLPIRVTVTVDGEDFTADFTGSAPQAAGPMNATHSVTASAVYNALLHLTDPTIPRNDGCYRPIKMVVPEGSILNCKHPAALVGGNTEISPRITDIIFGALSEAMPDKVPASLGGTSCCFLFGGQHPDSGAPYAHFHFEGVGWGAKHQQDGNNTVVVINGNCRNTPVEIFETRYPFVTECYRLLTDSGGPGEWRGGLGGERILTVTAPQITASALFNRMTISPFGLFGGKEGARSGIYIKPKGDDEFRTFQEVFGTLSPSKFSGVVLKQGDQVRIVFPGGGGFGSPVKRSRESVESDIRVGFISEGEAERAYGY